MCGIAGVHAPSSCVDPLALERAMRALRHRGPDGEGSWVSDDCRIGLAHTRLSIIDPQTGAQPIANEDESIHIVVNGEFYGFERIRRELEQRGHVFRTKSDAEIAIHLYEECGTACLAELRGEFAFILWDSRLNRLFAARDRFGIKPLYYSVHNNSVYLASEAKSLFAAGVPAKWDDRVAYALLLACVSNDETLFRNVRQIPPGHFVLSYGSELEIQRYWDADYPLAPRRNGTRTKPGDVYEEVRSLVEESVKLRLRADVPVGCLLSGGLDSAVALGVASRHLSKPMDAFTISFDHPEYDESLWAKDSADFNAARLNIVSAADDQLGDNFVESVRQGEIMQYNAHGTARFLLSRAVRDAGYKTVLAGEGADELFAGYGFCRNAVLKAANGNGHTSRIPLDRARRLIRLLRPSTPEQATIREVSPWLARVTKVMDIPPWLMQSLAGRVDSMRSVMSAELRNANEKFDPYERLFASLDAAPKIRGREPAKQLIYLWLKTVFPGYILTADRADMAHSIEVRLPFLDHVLFERLREIPVETLAFGGENKHLLRESASRYLSPATRTRAKKPLMAPPFTPKRGKLYTVINDVVRSDAMRDVPFFSSKAVADLADNAHRQNGDGRASADPLLIMAASTCILQQAYRL